MEYRRGDVRDPQALHGAFEDIDVVVHLAFMITGTASAQTIRAINVEGTINAFAAAAAAEAQRFVYASSVAAYGFHPDNPIGMTEDWPVRPADRLFYAQEKAELEQLLLAQAEDHPDIGLYMLRPPVMLDLARQFRVPIPVPAPDLPMQLIHEDDVGQALFSCVVAAGPPGAYNIAGDGVLTVADVLRELGLTPLPLPAAVAQGMARAAALIPRAPFIPPAVEWVEAVSHPAIMDTTRAREELGWRPRYTGLEALRDTLRGR